MVVPKVLKGTKPERQIAQCLQDFGLKFEMRDRNLPGTPDIVLKNYPIIVFIHGCFHHQYAECGAAEEVLAKNRQRAQSMTDDRLRFEKNEAQLLEDGWTVFVLWECHITRSAVDESLKIKRAVDKLQKNASSDG